MVTIYFREAQITVSIEETDVEWTQLTVATWLLNYRPPAIDPPALIFGSDGLWKVDGDVLNPGDRSTSNDRLVLRRLPESETYEALEGALDLSVNLTVSVGELRKFLGDRLTPSSAPGLWLTGEGLVIAVRAETALRGPGAKGSIPALFRKTTGTAWEWRLLDRWPRKGVSDEYTTLRKRVAGVFQWFAGRLPFIEKSAPDSAFRLLGEEEALGEPTDPTERPQFTPFRKDASGATPWWRLDLITARLRLSSAPRKEAGRGVLTDVSSGEVLELRPREVHFRAEAADRYEYRLIEGPDRERLKDTLPTLEIELHNDEDAIRAVIAPAETAVATDLVLLPPGENEGAPTQLWLRESEGFARLSAVAPKTEPPHTWPISGIEHETRDLKVSAWLDAAQHPNVRYLDLSLLLDNCGRLELALGYAAGTWTARLRVWEPAVRLTLGRHATLGLGQLRPELPPFENPSAPGPGIFQPLVLLSRKVAGFAARAPFTGALEVRTGGIFAVPLDDGATLTRWRRLPRHPVAAPAAWAVNDPAATGSLSALRALVPFAVPGKKVALLPARGALEIESAPGVVPDEFSGKLISPEGEEPKKFSGETLALVSEPELGFEIVLLASEAEVRRCAGVPALDYHWQRSVPVVPGSDDASRSVPIEQTWVQGRILARAALTAPQLLTTKLRTTLEQFPSPAKPPAPPHTQLEKLTVHRVRAAGETLFTLAVWRDREVSRWTLCTASGGPATLLAGMRATAVQLSLDPAGAAGELTLELRASTETVDRLIPFPGPGALRLKLRKDGNDFEIASVLSEATDESRVVFSGPAFLAVVEPGDWKPTRLKAVDSEKVSLRREDGEVRLVLEDLRFWFDAENEIFSVQTAQALRLRAGDGRFIGLSESDYGKTGPFLRMPGVAGFYFELRQNLPGLLLEERLLEIENDLPGTDKAGSPMLVRRQGGADELRSLNPQRIGDGWEFCTAGPFDYAERTLLGPTLEVELQAVTRVYLRLERLRSVDTRVSAPFFRVESGMIGWTAKKLFKLRPADATAPQVTLRCDAAGWQLALNGRVSTSDQGNGQHRLKSELTFWDGLVPVADAGGDLAIDWERVPGEAVEIPALYSGDLQLGDRARKWNAFLTARLPKGEGATPEIHLDAVFSIEPMEKKAMPTGLAFRRPETRLDLWDFPAAMPLALDRARVVKIAFRASINAGALRPRADDPETAATSRWTSFYFGPGAQLAATTGGAGAFPGGAWSATPPGTDTPGVEIFGMLDPEDIRLVGYTLFTTDEEAPIWLRCPVGLVRTERDPVASQPCVWIWNLGRLQKLWIHDPLATAAAGALEDKEVAMLKLLATQMLSFSRWHKGAILEHSMPPVWELIDSPLLNRSLELDVLTRAADPTGEPRFPDRDADYAPPPGAGRGIAATAAPIAVSANGQPALGARPDRLAKAPMAPHLTVGVQAEFAEEGVTEFGMSLSRSIPFELDAGRHYRWPVLPLAPLPASPKATAGTLPHWPVDMKLALYTPRPGEIVAHQVTAMALRADDYILSHALTFSSYTPRGDNTEVGLQLTASALPAPAGERYRDHQETIRLAWQRQHQIVANASSGAPVIALHSPEITKETTPDEPVWLRLALAPEDRAPVDSRVYALLAPHPPTDGVATLRVEIVETGEIVERTGGKFALLLASSLANDPPRLADRNLRITLLGAQRAAQWKVSVCREATAPTAAVDKVTTLKPTETPPWVAASLASDTFSIGQTSLSRAAKPLPALIALIRRAKSGDAALLVAFGPDGQGWEPAGPEGAIRWIKRGEFLDQLPAGTFAKWTYEMVLLQGDGSSQLLPITS